MNLSLLTKLTKRQNLHLSALAIFVLTAFSTPVLAEQNKVDGVKTKIKIISIGSSDCKTWLFDRDKAINGSRVEIWSDIGGLSWVVGFLSGMNFASEGSKDYLGAIDADTIFLWVDRYCVKNPNKDTFDAAIALFSELKKITKNKK